MLRSIRAVERAGNTVVPSVALLLRAEDLPSTPERGSGARPRGVGSAEPRRHVGELAADRGERF